MDRDDGNLGKDGIMSVSDRIKDPVILTQKQWEVIKFLIKQLDNAFDFGPDIYQQETDISLEEYCDLLDKLGK